MFESLCKAGRSYYGEGENIRLDVIDWQIGGIIFNIILIIFIYY